ncbi:glycoside hydrolase family 3 protein [Trichoderma asperellum CBS 433.97]|uniref:Beta-glucosidase cel3A n=1 Tax=Trichoderma asperellum (strain ATCC 204424 / CBS 433.97 / NBRC 101777) TaxID=1042311 RepID=A0A2T3ZMV8_TRIA4|nr:glycoside hydrolase family 3 protein [Trichoderma asperellum CBS 433.97]PTB46138.1 glycoside hydrolase family 3 protein [Trichoderma asperellum CBS 433.97]
MKTPFVLAATAAIVLDLVAAANDSDSQPRIAETTASHPSGQAYSPPFYPSPWMDPNAPGWEQAYAQAKHFVSGLTLLEKVNLTTGVGWMGEKCVGNVGTVPRLGMRSLCMQDGPLGLRFNDYNSAFDVGLTAAASWSRALWQARGTALGAEAKGKGVDVLLGPVAGPLGRNPNGGRNVEGFGPDPVLAGQALAQTVIGIQNAGTIACAKHFLLNEQEHFRQVGEANGYGFPITEALSSNIDDKTIHEMYGWPFQDAVKAGVGSIMCSYNQVNNSYACQNSKLINGLLKEEYGFQGFVMSDWQAQHTGAASAVAGLDMTMPGDTLFNTGASYFGSNLTLAVLNGTVPEWRVDDMVMRIMAAFFKVGKTIDSLVETNFDSWTTQDYGFVQAAVNENWEQVNFQVDVRADHANHIRESAAKGTVILKNTGILPLKKPKFLTVIGEDAGGNPAGPNGCGDRGCDDGTLAMEWGSGTTNFPYLVTPDQALSAQALQDGTRYESILSNYDISQTQALAGQPDAIAIVFANSDSGEGYIHVDGNEGDRNNLTVWKNGDNLIKSVAAVNSKTIVVIHSTGPVIVKDYAAHPNISAILWAGAPGQESGHSLVDILYGKQSPGRSPFTWGPSIESYGTEVMMTPNNGNGAPQDDFTEGLFIDYRHFDKVAPGKSANAPTYEFGFGLGWSTFKFSGLNVQKNNVGPLTPPSGKTIAAPILGTFSKNLKDYGFPKNIRRIKEFIYPYLNSVTSGKEASGDAHYGQTAKEFLPAGATDGSPQPRSAASGEPGGNRQLYDVVYTVTAVITNTGKVMDDVIPQLYISHGGPNDPPKVLRGFDRIERVAPGQSVIFKADITRRDISNWDSTKQQWVVTNYPKTVYVGSSSRNLPLSARLR